MPDNIDADDIAQAANEPASASVGGQSYTDRSIADKIAAAKFKAAQDAADAIDSGGVGFRVVKISPPGAT